jgi:hydrogenase/urease accessory protein HupE
VSHNCERAVQRIRQIILLRFHVFPATKHWMTVMAGLLLPCVALQGVEAMLAAGLVASRALDLARRLVAPGVTTDYIDREVHR